MEEEEGGIASSWSCWWIASSAGPEIRVSATAENLNSGCIEIGSIASLVTALMARSSPNTSFQWKGAKQLPGRTRSVTMAGRMARPRLDRTSTWSLSTMPSASASSGWSSMNGPGLSLLSVGTFPVLVRVCHWCWRRPVLRISGNSASGISAGSMCGRGRKCALPPGSGNASRGWLPSSCARSFWLTPSLR